MNKPDSLHNVRVVLSHTSHPGNIGAAARAMKTMGIGALYLVNPKHFPDAEATARSSGAADVLEKARVCTTLDEALEGTVLAVALTTRRRDLTVPLFDPREAATEILTVAATQPVALVFGNETSGLTVAEVARCQLLVTIPGNPEYSSLNLAAAVQVMAYELRMALPRVVTPEVPGNLASHEDIERFYRHLEDVLVDIEFLDPRQPRRLMQRLRRLFGRSRLEREELAILRGILSAVDKVIVDKNTRV